ncbi:hypothetical protein KAH43_01120 [Candidatus Bipolaricaulota bacterium]|nr:hypothetical protein [Candidatus Bipolaricaulota bacterium]
MDAKSRIAPEIYRQRLLIEGYYEKDITRDVLSVFLMSLAEHLGLRTYGEPVVYSPETGMGKSENAGFDAFVPLIDSGISAYVWIQAKFISILIYTCKGFDEDRAVAYAQDTFLLGDPIETQSF